MKGLYKWYKHLSKRLRDSFRLSFTIVGFISVVFTVLGVSLASFDRFSLWERILLVITVTIVICFFCYSIIGLLFKDSINIEVNQTPVCITFGNIFEMNGWKVIGCDSHFDTRVDDIVIAKKSLHGQLVLNHGNRDDIEKAVEREAKRLNLNPNDNGQYDFPLGTIIRYDNSKENNTYLMLAMTKLDKNNESHTNMAEYEQTLMRMWKEISRVYALHDIVVPLLGAGIPRFDSGPIGKDALLRCMLCTFSNSGISYNSHLKIVLYGDSKDIPLYEHKDMFQSTF